VVVLMLIPAAAVSATLTAVTDGFIISEIEVRQVATDNNLK
jgi:hypothetical protein